MHHDIRFAYGLLPVDSKSVSSSVFKKYFHWILHIICNILCNKYIRNNYNVISQTLVLDTQVPHRNTPSENATCVYI